MLSSFFSRTSILCFHVIPSFLFFLNHCSGKDFISTLPLPCYMLTNTHTHINCTMSALFLLSCQASQCLFYSSYSCCTPPTHSIHTTVNYLPLLILFSFLFPLSLLFLHTACEHHSCPLHRFSVLLWLILHSLLTEEQISSSVLSSAPLSPHETTGMDGIMRDKCELSWGWSMLVLASGTLLHVAKLYYIQSAVTVEAFAAVLK